MHRELTAGFLVTKVNKGYV